MDKPANLENGRAGENQSLGNRARRFLQPSRIYKKGSCFVSKDNTNLRLRLRRLH